jgi:hypothetical protein
LSAATSIALERIAPILERFGNIRNQANFFHIMTGDKWLGRKGPPGPQPVPGPKEPHGRQRDVRSVLRNFEVLEVQVKEEFASSDHVVSAFNNYSDDFSLLVSSSRDLLQIHADS